MIIPMPMIISTYSGPISDKAAKALMPCLWLLYIGMMFMVTQMAWDGWKDRKIMGYPMFFTGLFIWLALLALPIGIWIYI